MAWTPEAYDAARREGPQGERGRQLVAAVVQQLLPAARNTSAFVPLADGLVELSRHAQGLGYQGVVLFLDELVLWLLSRAADPQFVGREGAKIAALVEGRIAEAPIPIMSFVARLRDLREALGDSLTGAAHQAMSNAMTWWEERFHIITLEDRNLPLIVEERLLKPRDQQARALIDEAFNRVFDRANPAAQEAWLTAGGTREEFRRLYPFSPALVQVLVAVSGALQRERTALRILLQMLSEQRERLELGQLVPRGDLWDAIAAGEEVFAPQLRKVLDDAWRRWLAGVPGLCDLPEDRVQALCDHLVAQRILRDDDGLLWFDERGERCFGRRQFLELVSVFTSRPMLLALYGRTPIAELDWLTFSIDHATARQQGLPTILTIAGRFWEVIEFDARRREVAVVPATDQGRTRWLGSGRDLACPLAQAEWRVLAGQVDESRWSRRASAALAAERERHAWLAPDRPTLRLIADGAEWWTGAGTAMNRLLAPVMDPEPGAVAFDHLRLVRHGCWTVDAAVAAWREALTAVQGGPRNQPRPAQLAAIKFADAVPEPLLAELVAERLYPRDPVPGTDLHIVAAR